MVTVDREALLQELREVSPGLSPKETVQQSSKFCFKDGQVMTFNEEVACRRPTILDIEGAVAALPLLHLLEKMKKKDVDIEVGNGRLKVNGKSELAKIAMDKEIELPIDEVEVPTKWKTLPVGFVEAVEIVYQCAYHNESHGHQISCVHLTKDYMEACDNNQIARFKIETGLDSPKLVKSFSIKNIVPMGATKFAETGAWLHFKVPKGLIMSCRAYVGEYLEVDGFFQDTNSEKMTLPTGMAEAIETAQEFIDDTMYDGSLKVNISPGKILIEGAGDFGEYQKVKKLNYKGRELEFLVAPNVLKEVVNKYKDILVGDRRIKVVQDRLLYATALSAAKKKKKKEANNGKEE